MPVTDLIVSFLSCLLSYLQTQNGSISSTFWMKAPGLGKVGALAQGTSRKHWEPHPGLSAAERGRHTRLCPPHA